MQDSVKDFFAHLHRDYLKARGYKKVRHTFSRELIGYTERFQFQGSAWNDSSAPWRCYINVGVEFHDFAARDTGFPGTHCSTRIEKILPGAPSQYDLPNTGAQEFVIQFADYIERASQKVAQQIQQIRTRYEDTKSALLRTD